MYLLDGVRLLVRGAARLVDRAWVWVNLESESCVVCETRAGRYAGVVTTDGGGSAVHAQRVWWSGAPNEPLPRSLSSSNSRTRIGPEAWH